MFFGTGRVVGGVCGELIPVDFGFYLFIHVFLGVLGVFRGFLGIFEKVHGTIEAISIHMLKRGV